MAGKQLKFFGFDIVDVGHLTGWSDGMRYEAKLGDPLTSIPLRFRISRHDDGRHWTAQLEQSRDGGVAFRLDGDDMEKLVAQCEARVRELRTQLEALTAPRS